MKLELITPFTISLCMAAYKIMTIISIRTKERRDIFHLLTLFLSHMVNVTLLLLLYYFAQSTNLYADIASRPVCGPYTVTIYTKDGAYKYRGEGVRKG